MADVKNALRLLFFFCVVAGILIVSTQSVYSEVIDLNWNAHTWVTGYAPGANNYVGILIADSQTSFYINNITYENSTATGYRIYKNGIAAGNIVQTGSCASGICKFNEGGNVTAVFYNATDTNMTITITSTAAWVWAYNNPLTGVFPYNYSSFKVTKAFGAAGVYRTDEKYRYRTIGITNITVTENLTITARDYYYGDTILNFSAKITNASAYELNLTSDGAGIINTTIMSSLAYLINLSVSAENYLTNIYRNWNVSSNIAANLTSTRSKVNVTAYQNSGAAISNFTVYFSSLNSSDIFNITTTNGTVIGRTIWNETYNLSADSDLYSFSISKLITANESIRYVNFTLIAANSFFFKFLDEITGNLVNDRNVSVDLIGDLYSANTSTVTGFLNFSLLTPQNYTIRYSALNYIQRFYFVELTNKSYSNLTLYMLSNSTAADVPVLVYDQTNQLTENVIIKLKKFNILTNSYELKEMQRTNFEGKAVIHPVLNSEYYKFTLEYNGEVVLETEPTYIFSTDTLQFTIVIGEPTLSGFYTSQGVQGNTSFNNATNNFRFTFNDPDNAIYGGCLYVYQTFQGVKTLYNGTCVQSVSSTILISVPGTNHTTYEGIGYIKPTSSILEFHSSAIYSFGELIDESPKTPGALFFVALLTIIAMFVGKWDIRIAMILTPIPTFVCSILGLIAVDKGIATGILLLGFFAAWLVRK